MRLLSCAFFTLVACSSDGFTGSQSQALFDESNAELHAMHQAYFALDPRPEGDFLHSCPEGGEIAMSAQQLDGEIAALLHEFNDCGLGGKRLSGNLDYLDFERGICSGSGFGFDIQGELDIEGDLEGSCLVDAREVCGVFSGMSCGHPVE